MNWGMFFFIAAWFIGFAVLGALLRAAIFKFIQKDTTLDFRWGVVVAIFIGIFYSFITYNSFDSGTRVSEGYIINQATLFGLFVAAIIDRIESWITKFAKVDPSAGEVK